MTHFSNIERKALALLGRQKQLRELLKSTYQKINFALYGERNFKFWISEKLNVCTPSQKIRCAEPENDTAEYFGYFDRSPWSPDGRFYVVHHKKTSSKIADIVVYDFKKNTRIVIGQTAAFTLQQGAMPHWLIYANQLCVSFNCLEGGLLGTKLYLPEGQEVAFLELPLQALNQNFSKFYAINYLRLHANKTEYGYKLNAQNLTGNRADEADGIWSIDLINGKKELIISLKQLLNFKWRNELKNCNHEVNHLAVAPDGQHFVFIHRFRNSSAQYSRLFVCNHSGNYLKLLLDEDMVSHYTWLSPRLLLVWAKSFDLGNLYYLVDIFSNTRQPFPHNEINLWGDGHPTYCSTSNLIVTDSYADRRRQQHLLLANLENGKVDEIGRFYLPTKFSASERIDLHPRWRSDGTELSIDSGCKGYRRNYIIELISR
jgi:hypothetical protein